MRLTPTPLLFKGVKTLLQVEPSHQSLDTAFRVHDALFTRKEGVALRTYFYAKLRLGTSGNVAVTTATNYAGLIVICGVNSSLHSTRLPSGYTLANLRPRRPCSNLTDPSIRENSV